MSKLDEFKLFVKDKQFLIDKVHKNEITWQKLYETYDIYGSEHEIFKNIVPKKNSQNILSKDSINNAINLFKDIDLEKVSSSLESIKKVVGTIQEITKGDNVVTDTVPEYIKKSSFRRYND